MERNPFVGPRPFAEGDEPIMAGRRRDVRDVTSLIIANRVVVLHARSGVGKTSLVHAGIIPRLRAEGIEPLPTRVAADAAHPFSFNIDDERFRRSTHPSSLAEAIRTTQREAPEERTNFLLILEQCEEMFIRAPMPGLGQARDDFFRGLDDALSEDPALRILFVIRDEYVTALEAYAHLIQRRLDTRYHLFPLDAAGALEVLRVTARAGGKEFAAGVAERLIDSLRTIRTESGAVLDERVDPVQLQIVAHAIWQSLPPECERITDNLVAPASTVAEALEDYFDTAMNDISSDEDVSERDLRVWIETTLITSRGTRNVLIEGAEVSAGMPNSVIKALSDRHLIRTEIRSGFRFHELAHDRLVGTVQTTNARFFENTPRPLQLRESEPRRIPWFRRWL